MATGGDASITSDVIFDFPCSICAKEDNNQEAEKYCVECEEYMCAACVKNHSSFLSMARHNLIERSNFKMSQTFAKRTVPSMPTERCPTHPTKLIDMYCEDHDSVHCRICITTDHGLCAKIHKIPDYVQRVHESKPLTVPDKDVQLAITKLNKTLCQQKQARNDLENAKKKCDKEIEDFRSRINQLVDVSACEANAVYDNKKTSLEASTQTTKYLLSELEVRNKTSKMSDGNLAQHFVNTKTINHLIKRTDELSRKRSVDPTICFQENSDIMELLEKTKSFGRVEVKKKVYLYKVQKSARLCVKQTDDEKVCDIWSCCLLDSGDILLADYENRKLKRLDQETYKVSDSLKFAVGVHSICRVSISQVAVTLYNRSLVLVNTENKLKCTETFQMDSICRGIAVMGDSLYISNRWGESVREFSLKGELRKDVFHVCKSRPVYRGLIRIISSVSTNDVNIREICSSDDGKALHLTYIHQGILTINRKGNIIWEFSGPELVSPYAVCTDGEGNVYATGKDSKTVVQLSENGEYVGKVVPESAGLVSPKGLCFVRSSNKLIVCTECSDEIHVFDLI